MTPSKNTGKEISAEELSRYILAKLKKEGADDVVISSGSKSSLMIKFSNNLVNTTKTVDLSTVGIFMAMDKKLVSTNLIDLRKSTADTTIRKLMSFAKSAEKNKDYHGIAEGKFKYKDTEGGYDPKLEKLGENSVDIVKDALSLSAKEGAKRSSGVLETDTTSSYLLTSNGLESNEKGTRIYFSIRSFTDKDASGHMVSVSRNMNDFDWKYPVKKAAEIAVSSRKPQGIEPGKYDVIFDFLPYANVLNTVGSASSIFSVETGLSFLAGQMGKKVGSNNITFTDDATLKNGFFSTNCDAEGVPTQKNTIIDKGILKTYLHNTSTAKRYGTKTTANAGITSPSAFNLSLEAGNLNKDEMITSIKRGLYITNVWYTRFQNYATGDFSTIPRDGAFLIENGKIIHPVKDIRVSDNVLNILRSTEALTKERRQIFGWEVDVPTITPMALARNINITRSEK
jgi:PmbA protein